MKSVPLAHVLCELHVEENKTFDGALISLVLISKKYKMKMWMLVGAKIVMTWDSAKIHDVRHKTQYMDLICVICLNFDWILFYWLNLTCDWLGNIVVTWETWDTTCGTLMCDSFKWAAWLNFDLLVGELDMELVWQLERRHIQESRKT